MSRRPPPRRAPAVRPLRPPVGTGPSDERGRLEALARVLVDPAVQPDPTSAAVGLAVGVEGLAAPEDAAVHLRDLHGHPCDVLLGVEAPDDWDAFGLLVAGTARTWQPDGDDLARPADTAPSDDRRPAADGDRVVLVLLVARSGTAVSIVRRADRPDHHVAPATDGMLVDLCQRVLGLPTAPASEPVGRFWTVLWLDRVVEALTAIGPVEWETAALLHPGVDVLAALVRADRRAGDDPTQWPSGLRLPRDDGVSVQDLDLLHQVVAGLYTWDDVHDELSEPGSSVLGLTSEQVGWMDAGMLSRWLLGTLPEVDDLLATIDTLAEPTLAMRVRGTLRRWGQLPTAPA